MGQMDGVTHDVRSIGPASAAGGAFLGSFYQFLQCLPVYSRVVSTPSTHREGKGILHHMLVESCQGWGVKSNLLDHLLEVEVFGASLLSYMQLIDEFSSTNP